MFARQFKRQMLGNRIKILLLGAQIFLAVAGMATPVAAFSVSQNESHADVAGFYAKTNLLYDYIATPNLEIEIPLSEKISLDMETLFPWWNLSNRSVYEILEFGIEPRYHLNNHFVGLYGLSAQYDIQHMTRYCYQGELWSIGLSYGYMYHVSESLSVEFSISLGYLRSDYRHYNPDSEYRDLYLDPYNAGILSYFGPTKLKVSLVFPFKAKNQGK